MALLMQLVLMVVTIVTFAKAVPLATHTRSAITSTSSSISSTATITPAPDPNLVFIRDLVNDFGKKGLFSAKENDVSLYLEKRGLLNEFKNVGASMAVDFGKGVGNVAGAILGNAQLQIAEGFKSNMNTMNKKALFNAYISAAKQELKTKSKAPGMLQKVNSRYHSYSYKHWSPERKSFDAFMKLYNKEYLKFLKTSQEAAAKALAQQQQAAGIITTKPSLGSQILGKIKGKGSL